MAYGLASPFSHGIRLDSSGPRLCLNQTAYELRDLLPGRPAESDDLVLRHLPTPGAIDMVRHLRSQIDLSHTANDPNFPTLEKKETS